jgi:D-proline reductase (dithiol) PrdB
VGLIARVVEAAGIPTLCMTSALDITQAVNPPRAVFLNFPLGHQTGKPHQPQLQSQIVRDAMRAFEAITRPGTIVHLPYIWDAEDKGWEETDYTDGFLPERPAKEDADRAEAERRERFLR